MKRAHHRKLSIKLWSIVLVIAAIGLYYFLPQFNELDGIIPILKSISWHWFIASCLFIVLTFFITTYVQYAAGNKIGRFSNIFIINMKGLFLNHFLPIKVGVIALTTRYYLRVTDPQRAVFLSIIPSVIFAAVSVGAVILLAPSALTVISNNIHHDIRGYLAPILTIITVIAIIWMIVYWKKVRPFLNNLAREFTSIKSICRLFLVSLYSIVLLLAFSGALMAASYSVGSPMTFLDAVTLYVLVWLTSCVIPTPGGLGTSEIALTVGAMSLGQDINTATATMLVYRFVSFWMPLIPTSIFMFVRQKYKRVYKSKSKSSRIRQSI